MPYGKNTEKYKGNSRRKKIRYRIGDKRFGKSSGKVAGECQRYWVNGMENRVVEKKSEAKRIKAFMYVPGMIYDIPFK